ncbi:MAG: hypothetical protein EOP06_12830, partial [Proteobacteria bacterium]
MNKMSIRWKIALAFSATALALIIAYVAVAKDVFRKDKFTATFETQSSALQFQKREIVTRLNAGFLATRSMIALYI